MNRERVVLVATAGLLLGVTFASGPFVGVSLTSEQTFNPGSGSIVATVEQPPENASLDRASHGSDLYYLRGPPIPVQVEQARGQPSLAYEIVIPELGHTTASITFLDDDSQGEIQLEFDPSTIEEDRVEAESYDGIVRVIANDDDGERVLAEANVTVEVEG